MTSMKLISVLATAIVLAACTDEVSPPPSQATSSSVSRETEAAAQPVSRERVFECVKEAGIKGPFEVVNVIKGGVTTRSIAPNENVPAAQAAAANACIAR